MAIFLNAFSSGFLRSFFQNIIPTPMLLNDIGRNKKVRAVEIRLILALSHSNSDRQTSGGCE
jgi:hypothetical protein